MKARIILVTVMLLSVFSCEKDDELNSFDFEKNENFNINEDYVSNDQSLEFTITEINDSRCPSDVVCVWQGAAIVTIQIESPLRDEITLSTYDNLIDTSGNYSFELLDVTPYPVSTETIELDDYEVSLKIIRLEF